MFGEADYRSVSEDLFNSLCPVLIYQLDKKVCASSSKGHDEGYHHDDHDHHHDDHDHHHDDHEHEPEAESGEVSEFDFAKIPAKGKSCRKKYKVNP